MPEFDPAMLSSWLDDRCASLVSEKLADAVPVAWQRVFLASDFAVDVVRRQPQLMAAADSPGLGDAHVKIAARIHAAVADIDAEKAFMAALRRARQREAVYLIYRAVNGMDDVVTTLHATNDLYVSLLREALQFASAMFAKRHGVARAADGSEQRLVVIGMGKLGGGELNFSSDIDLIFAYPEGGSSDGPRPLANEEYFSRLGQRLVHLLAERTIDGIVARVDMRLRPFGQSGRLALSFGAMEQYYQREGRDWERYAWIKAAPLVGDLEAGARLIEALRPFVYRRYLDYTAFAGLRKMKSLIDAEVARKDLADNIKLGAGGIREIEFCVQLIQLIRGGRERALRVRGLLDALAECAQRGLIEPASAERLRNAYLFLRGVENRLQMFADAQTHSAPQEALARARVAAALDYPDWAALQRELDRHRTAVGEEFATLLIPHAGSDSADPADADASLWQAAVDGELTVQRMVEQGFEPGDVACAALAAVPRAAPVRAMSARSAQRLHRLMPRLLADARASAAPTPCLQRLCRLVQAVARRSAYLALLEEQPAARQHLAELFAGSAFLADKVIAQPLLLDDVLDPRMDQLPLRRSDIAEAIAQELASLDERHAEDELERLSETRSSLAFRLGLAFRDGRADAPATARRLAALAEAVVGVVLTLAQRDLADKHGWLGDGRGFAVLGYGSLGGAELGFASDLDLVFIYDAALSKTLSQGSRPLEGVSWFQRLAQRVVHWLGALHHGGRMYDVDTRLRPDGSKGMLVTSMQAFAAYQRNRAWSWEHQALLRARGIAGDAAVLRQFDALRGEVIGRPRELAQVRHDVADMRVRWRRERDRSDATHVDLKQGRGALLDLEFFLQGLVLAHAAQCPALVHGNNAPAWLAGCRESGLLTAASTEQLGTAHAQLLDMALACTLDARPRVVARSPATDAACACIGQAAHAAGFDFG